uniref:FAD/NAD(P)-binding protein n=1 Tax=Streptomyces harbinensis TaxID=1176198 RepID=UPI0034DE1A3C
MSTGVDADACFDAVVVGGGPRAVSVVERLAARHPDGAPPVRVAVLDRVEVGAGATWRTDQSPLLLNNTYSAHTTVYTDESTPMDGPVTPGPDLITWARESTPPPDRPAWVAAEAAALRPWSYPTRRIQGVYYREQLARAEATGRVVVTRVLGEAVALERDGGADGARTVRLADGRALRGRIVVLAQGMVQAKRSARTPPRGGGGGGGGGGAGMPAERDWDRVPGGETVLVTGLGANFFDVVALLTEGRGGTFEPAGDPARPARLRYRPSGREPHLVAGSRRGLPYRSKAAYASGFPPRYVPRLATADWFAGIAAGRGQDFRRDVWPQLAREFAWAHLSTLLDHHPGALVPGTGAADLLDRLRAAPGEAAVDEVVACAVADALGIDTVVAPPLAGVLSAYGIGVADATALRERSVERELTADGLPAVRALCADLAAQARRELVSDGVPEASIRTVSRLHLRYAGTDAALPVALAGLSAMAEEFAAAHRARYGFTMD